jgi:hypothetical protein
MLASTSKQQQPRPLFYPKDTANLNASGLPANGTAARTNQHPWASFPRQVENPRPYLSLCVCAALSAPQASRASDDPALCLRQRLGGALTRPRHVVAEGEDTSRLLGAMARRAVAGHERGID